VIDPSEFGGDETKMAFGVIYRVITCFLGPLGSISLSMSKPPPKLLKGEVLDKKLALLTRLA
jgi:hypothetical protein